MKPPPNTTTFECTIARFWFDGKGIFHCVAKDVKNNLSLLQEASELADSLLHGTRSCILVDATHAHPLDKASREFALRGVKNHYKAMAFLSESLVGTMAVNIFLKMKRPQLPTKLFTSEKEAREWLEGFL